MTTRGIPDPQNLKLSEYQLQSTILEMAKFKGWLSYHTYDSRRSAPGFPDLVLVHPGPSRPALLFAELKTATGKTTEAQDEWARALVKAGHPVHLWRPEHLVDGTVLRDLDAAGGS